MYLHKKSKETFIALIIIILICYCTGIDTSNSYAEQKDKEYHLKAAFLLNFAKFMTWPSNVFSDTSQSLTIYILGKDPFGRALQTIEDKTVKGRKLLVKRIASVEDIKECHILFVCTSEMKKISEILIKTRNWPILTVSETENFCQAGGIVNFIIVKNKIRFEINVDAAKRIDLGISSKLLNLSKIIKER